MAEIHAAACPIGDTIDTTAAASAPHGDAIDEDPQCEEDERDVLEAYARSCDAIVAKTVQRYVGFVRRRKRVVDAERWQLIAEARGLRVYKERVEQRQMKSFVSTATADDDNDERKRKESPIVPVSPTAPIDDRTDNAKQQPQRQHQASSSGLRSLERQTSVIESPSTMVSAFCIGRLRGTLDSVLVGLYADSADDMRTNCAIQFGDELRACGIVETFERAHAAQPLAYFGVKWLEKQSPHAPSGVPDQLCWVERTGVHTIASGRRFGFQLLKSLVRLEDATVQAGSRHTAAAARPLNVSLCYVYCQLDKDVVEVFVRGIVEIGSVVRGDGADHEDAAVRTAGDFILAAMRGRECARMRTIAQLIDLSKTARKQLTACHCSTVIRGLAKVEMCTTCQQAMRRPKLVDVRALARQQTTIQRNNSSADAQQQLPRSAAHQQLLLQSRLGSVRHDAEVPATLASYREDQSFRMFLPIRDPRPTTTYRRARRKHGNVLMQMLQRNARSGSFLPTFLRSDNDSGDIGEDEIAAAVRHAVRST